MALLPKGHVLRAGGHFAFERRTPDVRARAADESGREAAIMLLWCVEATCCVRGRARVSTVAGFWAEEARREDSSLEIIVAPSVSGTVLSNPDPLYSTSECRGSWEVTENVYSPRGVMSHVRDSGIRECPPQDELHAFSHATFHPYLSSWPPKNNSIKGDMGRLAEHIKR